MRVDFVECIKQSLYYYYLFLDKPVMPQGENNLFIPLSFYLLLIYHFSYHLPFFVHFAHMY
jgi:hypothetical protein